MYITENLTTKIEKNCDVLVCGGGFGGIAAALAAARHGAKVILLEKQFVLGGLGTAGLVTIYLPLCDGYGKQVSFGIAEELLRLSIAMGPEDRYPANWLEGVGSRTEQDDRFMVQFNPHLFAIMVEQLLLEEGVEILYGSYAVSAHRTEDKIDAVMVENKSGRFGIAAKSFVDATGDADIALFAGAPTETFKQGNVLAAWYYFVNQSGYNLKMLGWSDIPDDQKVNGKQVELLRKERYTGLDGDEISRFMIHSHASTLNDVKKLRKNDPTTVPTILSSIP
ncbi:MAG: FAD-dependent oxidoreductase, partial [Clostridia bacterium]|nr:FAD-dependent oxidoreductase [Clostridia bacterium]